MNLLIFLVGIILAVIAARPKINPKIRWTAIIIQIAILVIAPLVTKSTAILFDALTAMCIAYGWNFIGGYTGYASFGNAAFLGLGAYVAAGFMSRQSGHPNFPWFIGIPLAVVIVSIVAGLLGIALLRLRGQYFSIATLGIFVAMPEVINWDLFFGQNGPFPNFFGGGLPLNFPLVRDVMVLGVKLSADQHLFYYLGLATALFALLLTALVSRSKFGYSLIAIRENEEAAEVMGINATRSKVLAFMLSAALAALGGAVVGFKLTNMTTEAEALFSTVNNLQMIIVCLIGGLGTLWGPWIGAFALFGIQELLRVFSGNETFLRWEAVVFGVVIVLVVLFLPRGLMWFVRGQERLTWRSLLKNLQEFRV
ncbi:MAG: branched-chain amino acid ABC transporter permease [Chloroflexota bacterium]